MSHSDTPKQPPEGLIPPEESTLGEYRVELPVFEGPLDLLLHLIRKHEINIFDIPVSLILDEYMSYLAWMKSLNLDVAGEFLVMASTLIQIKSRTLLPAGQVVEEDEADDDDQQDPRDELVRQLLEYQRYKDVAEQLRDKPILNRDVFPRGGRTLRPKDAGSPFVEVSVFKLIEALDTVMRNAARRISHEVLVEKTSIAQRIQEVAEILVQRGELVFQDLFLDDVNKPMIIVTFLAVLEMARLRMIRLHQADGSDIIYIRNLLTKVEDVGEALSSEKFADESA